MTQGLEASRLVVKDSSHSKLRAQKCAVELLSQDPVVLKPERPLRLSSWGNHLRQFLWSSLGRLPTFPSGYYSAVIAIVLTIIARYTSQFQLRLPTRFAFIICCALNLVLAIFMEEIPPPCDDYHGLGHFCVDCATNPLPNQHPSFLAPDYALSPEGAIVIDLTSPTLLQSPYSPDHYYTPTPPIAVIEEDVRVSRCWKFSGSQGHVAVKLAKAIHFTNMTIYYPDHRELPSWRRAEAPKLLRIWALLPSDLDYPMLTVQTASWESFLIADGIPKPMVLEDAFIFVQGNMISYNAAEGTKQTFPVDFPGVFKTMMVIIEILDNWGANMTCLNRFAVHGAELLE